MEHPGGAVQLIKRSGRRSGRYIKLESISTEQVIAAMWKNEIAWRGTGKEERTLGKKGKPRPRGRPALKGEIEKEEPADNWKEAVRKTELRSVNFMEVTGKGTGKRSTISKAPEHSCTEMNIIHWIQQQRHCL